MSKIRNYQPLTRRAASGFSLATMQEEINRMFDHLYNGAQVHLTDWDNLPASAPAVNVIEKGKGFRIEVALPGIEAKDVRIEAADGALTVSGEHREEKEEKDEGFLHREIAYGSFMRSVPLPETADCDKADAVFKSGILMVTVPKKAGVQQKSRKISIKEAA